MSANPQPVTIALDAAQRVSGLLQAPPNAHACYVMAHGAGAGMAHPFMTSSASHLAERGIATLRYQFPYMERGSKRPDSPRLHKRPSVPRWRRHRAWCPDSPCSQAANPSAGA